MLGSPCGGLLVPRYTDGKVLLYSSLPTGNRDGCDLRIGIDSMTTSARLLALVLVASFATSSALRLQDFSRTLRRRDAAVTAAAGV